MTETDFDFVMRLAKEFFARRRIQKALEIIGRDKIRGWEKWLQIEFVVYLSERADEVSWSDLEWPVQRDGRKDKAHSKAFIDVALRRKRHRTPIWIELKTNTYSTATCIRELVDDYDKHKLILNSQKGRSLLLVGIHPRETSKIKARNILNRHVSSSDQTQIATFHIPKTNYSCTTINL